ncbi:MAG: lamin tail domain-containing protein [Flavobacteriales bacterium]|jgi:hypothetical protein|nr:lamin tail domain-containing protein [Flavobacteriales bacterium]
MKHALLSTALIILSSLVGANSILAQGIGLEVVITEIMYNPPEAGTDSLEYIELFNPNEFGMIDLSGYYFSDGIEYTFPQGVNLPAGDFLILAKDSVAFTGISGVPSLQWVSMSLLNTGEGITLRNSLTLIADTVNYNDNSPWPPEANGLGASLVLCNPFADNNDVNNWEASSNATGLIVNNIEIYADPDELLPCAPVGLDDDAEINELNVYPNPNNGQFRVSLDEVDHDMNLELFDVSGKLVYAETINAGHNRNVSIGLELKRGIYILRAGETHDRLVVSE